MTRLKSTKLIALSVAIAALSGCTSTHKMAAQEISKQSDMADRMLEQGRQMINEPRESREFDEFFVLGNPYESSQYGEMPSTLRQNLVYKTTEPISMSDLTSELSRDLGLRFKYSDDAMLKINEMEKGSQNMSMETLIVESAMGTPEVNLNYNNAFPNETSNVIGSTYNFSVDHQGSVASLLDRLTSQVGLFWEWRNDHVHIFFLKQRTFTLDFMPSEVKVNSTVTTNRSNSDSGGGSNRTSQAISEEYSTENSYDELNNAIEQLLTPEHGVFSINQNFGLLTVKDTPTNLDLVEEFIDQLNEAANTNISIRTQIYEIVIEDNADLGMDLSALFSNGEKFNLDFGTQFTSGQTPNITGTFTNPEAKIQSAVSTLRANNALLDFSTVTDFVTSTKNNQAAPIQIVNETGYVESAQRTPATNEEPASLSLTPGTVLDGVTMTVIPRILSDDSVDLSINFDISNLNGINEVRVGEGETEALLQLTDVTSKTFKNTLNIDSGRTVMLTGFEKTVNNNETNSLFGKKSWWAGGSKRGGKSRVMNVILVTPYISGK